MFRVYTHFSSMGVTLGANLGMQEGCSDGEPPHSLLPTCIVFHYPGQQLQGTCLEWNSQPLSSRKMLLKIHTEMKGSIDFCCILYIEIYFNNRINISPFESTALKLLPFSSFFLNHSCNLFSNLLIYQPLSRLKAVSVPDILT